MHSHLLRLSADQLMMLEATLGVKQRRQLLPHSLHVHPPSLHLSSSCADPLTSVTWRWGVGASRQYQRSSSRGSATSSGALPSLSMARRGRVKEAAARAHKRIHGDLPIRQAELAARPSTSTSAPRLRHHGASLQPHPVAGCTSAAAVARTPTLMRLQSAIECMPTVMASTKGKLGELLGSWGKGESIHRAHLLEGLLQNADFLEMETEQWVQQRQLSRDTGARRPLVNTHDVHALLSHLGLSHRREQSGTVIPEKCKTKRNKTRRISFRRCWILDHGMHQFGRHSGI